MISPRWLIHPISVQIDQSPLLDRKTLSFFVSFEKNHSRWVIELNAHCRPRASLDPQLQNDQITFVFWNISVRKGSVTQSLRQITNSGHVRTLPPDLFNQLVVKLSVRLRFRCIFANVLDERVLVQNNVHVCVRAHQKHGRNVVLHQHRIVSPVPHLQTSQIFLLVSFVSKCVEKNFRRSIVIEKNRKTKIAISMSLVMVELFAACWVLVFLKKRLARRNVIVHVLRRNISIFNFAWICIHLNVFFRLLVLPCVHVPISEFTEFLMTGLEFF